MDLSAFHFLRPWFLLGVALAIALWAAGRGQRAGFGRNSGIATGLLPYLVVHTAGTRGPRPLDMVAAMLALGSVAAAGPAWQRDEPEFLDNVAPLVVAVDLSATMNATDVPPSRLEAAKHTVRDLAARRAGARTGLIAYAGSSHLVLPPTDDRELLDLFVQALSTDLIDRDGRDVPGVIDLTAQVLAAERAGGTLLLMTDGAPAPEQVRQRAQAADNLQTLVMAVGNTEAQGGIDEPALRALARAADAPLGSLTGTPDDLDWITLHAQQHFESVQDADAGPAHWKDAGYWLCWPLALLALLTLRRGWRVAWQACVFAGVFLFTVPPEARADGLADVFLTPDQQGRLAFERGEYSAAAGHFQDPYWKGRAAYSAGDYAAALTAFSQQTTAEAYFYVGNTQVRLRRYDAALGAYDRALALRPGWEPALVNRGIVTRLLAAMSQEQQGDQADPPDQTIADKTAKAGELSKVQVQQAASEDIWLRTLTLSPARFLRSKFAVQDAERQP
ncbi:VWA domain-containing protein [Achromobacter arsenitoxydans]|uniref:VWFA domain-containing protein n=1 Tax=Achromobacter arsenitoxydans SY8 TaxID=477184 RepID=H0F8D6_9BURK|nr:VWA domain-containing protein [Achromobacter arsenitoxydans]EHK65569.1 hypothetical protein KYC_15172 [Achromobacter arsenitoxydans SY8]